MKRILKLLSVICLLGFLFVFATSIGAQTINDQLNAVAGGDDTHPGFYETRGVNVTSVTRIIGSVIGSILGLLGTVFALMVVYGGFKWMASQGNPKEIEEAKNIVYNSAIGLVIIFAAGTITIWVYSTLLNSVIGSSL